MIPNLHFYLNYAINVRPIEKDKLLTAVTPEIGIPPLFCYFSSAISEDRSVSPQYLNNRLKMLSSLKQGRDKDHIPAGLKCPLSISHLISNGCSNKTKKLPSYYHLLVPSKMLCNFNTLYNTEFGSDGLYKQKFQLKKIYSWKA